MNFPLMKIKKQTIFRFKLTSSLSYLHKYSHPELSQGNFLLLRFEKKLEVFAFRQKFKENYFMQISNAEEA